MAKGKIMVLGGDGFCGWPTSLSLSKEGYDVIIVDNLSRRGIDDELSCQSLTPISSIDTRLERWKKETGSQIDYVNLSVAEDYAEFRDLIGDTKPDTIIHFAEQRAAPYSMRSTRHKRYTVNNNVNATNNTLCAIVETEREKDTHLVHLGTMGVYGYGTAGMQIPEGYMEVKVKGGDGKQKIVEISAPTNPGSIYHMTKCLDAEMFKYFAKNDKLKITDLHQGIVWGTNTEETSRHKELINRFDYGGDYGTALNRMLMQAATGHPLTVYGTGGQARAFIHIQDTVNCIKRAIENPPEPGERVKIFNQMSEVKKIRELAEKIQEMTGAKIRYYTDPRVEAPENELDVANDNFLNLGWTPILLEGNDGLLTETTKIAEKYKDRADKSKIICTSVWRKEIPVDREGQSTPINPDEQNINQFVPVNYQI